MRDLLNGSPGEGEEEEENNRSPLSAEAPELSSHSSDEVPLYFISCLSFFIIYCTFIQIHSYTFIHNIRWVPLQFLHWWKLRKRVFTGVPSRDSNSGAALQQPDTLLWISYLFWIRIQESRMACEVVSAMGSNPPLLKNPRRAI